MMKKMIALLVVLGTALRSTTLYAAEAGDGPWFWEKLRRKVELMARKECGCNNRSWGRAWRGR